VPLVPRAPGGGHSDGLVPGPALLYLPRRRTATGHECRSRQPHVPSRPRAHTRSLLRAASQRAAVTRSLADPDDLAAAADFASDASGDGLAVSLVGPCEAAFSGRAHRDLAAGVRQLLWKPDDTLLVHGAGGRDPEAWASGGPVTVDVRTGDDDGDDADDALVVACDGGSAADALRVRFGAVHAATAFDPAGADATTVSGTEADLKERVLADPDLVEPGFRPLATERETPAGRVDVYGRDADGSVVAVELKNVRAGPSAASQLERYVTALRRDLHADADVRGVLAAPAVTEKTRRLLAENSALAFSRVSPAGPGGR
jgi:RecB family endonuclease NucS